MAIMPITIPAKMSKKFIKFIIGDNSTLGGGVQVRLLVGVLVQLSSACFAFGHLFIFTSGGYPSFFIVSILSGKGLPIFYKLSNLFLHLRFDAIFKKSVWAVGENVLFSCSASVYP